MNPVGENVNVGDVFIDEDDIIHAETLDDEGIFHYIPRLLAMIIFPSLFCCFLFISAHVLLDLPDADDRVDSDAEGSNIGMLPTGTCNWPAVKKFSAHAPDSVFCTSVG